jgi:hypothetical protein
MGEHGRTWENMGEHGRKVGEMSRAAQGLPRGSAGARAARLAASFQSQPLGRDRRPRLLHGAEQCSGARGCCTGAEQCSGARGCCTGAEQCSGARGCCTGAEQCSGGWGQGSVVRQSGWTTAEAGGRDRRTAEWLDDSGLQTLSNPSESEKGLYCPRTASTGPPPVPSGRLVFW